MSVLRKLGAFLAHPSQQKTLSDIAGKLCVAGFIGTGAVSLYFGDSDWYWLRAGSLFFWSVALFFLGAVLAQGGAEQ